MEEAGVLMAIGLIRGIGILAETGVLMAIEIIKEDKDLDLGKIILEEDFKSGFNIFLDLRK